MAFLLGDAEWRALQGLPHATVRLYLEIRAAMDVATGIAGTRRRICWRGLAEGMHVEPAQGRRGAGTPRVGAVRRSFDALERAGLARLQSDCAGRRLLIFCPFAVLTDNSAKNKVRSKCADQTRRATAPAIDYNNNNIDNNPVPETEQARRPEMPEVRRHRFTVIEQDTTTARAHEGSQKWLSLLKPLSQAWHFSRLQTPTMAEHARAWLVAGVTPEDVGQALALSIASKGDPRTFAPEYVATKVLDCMRRRLDPRPSAVPGRSDRYNGFREQDYAKWQTDDDELSANIHADR